MPVEKTSIRLKTRGDCDVVDITDEVRRTVKESHIFSGTVTLFVPGSTAGITTIEYESGAINDLKRSFERLIPKDLDYEHNLRWGDGNGHSHIRASWLGPSLTVPFYQSELLLGTWQNIVFVDFDNRPREREVILLISGE